MWVLAEGGLEEIICFLSWIRKGWDGKDEIVELGDRTENKEGLPYLVVSGLNMDANEAFINLLAIVVLACSLEDFL